METLAFIHAHVDYEDPDPVPELRSLEDVRAAIVHSLWVGVAGGATVSIMATAPDAQAVVSRGDACAAVGSVQTALQQRGFSTGGTDSVFGGATEYAVLQFQRRNGLGADGVVGPATATALGLSSTISCGTTAAANTGGTATPATAATGNYRVESADGLNVRSGPGAGFPVIAGLANAAIVQAGAVNNGYRQLSTGGWVASQYLVSTTSTATTPASGTTAVPFAVGNTTGTSSETSTTTAAYRVSVSSGLNVRSGPGANFPVITGLADGAIVQVGEVSNGYRQLSTGGWVSSQYLVPASSSSAAGGGGGAGSGSSGGTPTRTARINTNGGVLNVRSGPGAGYSVASTLVDGATVQTTGRVVGDWIELANGRWVASRWIQR